MWRHIIEAAVGVAIERRDNELLALRDVVQSAVVRAFSKQ